MKTIWLDDVRPMPDNFQVWCKTASEALAIIKSGECGYISFDHDLGLSSEDGYHVALRIENLAQQCEIPPLLWDIHSANPVGRSRIRQALENADKFFYGDCR